MYNPGATVSHREPSPPPVDEGQAAAPADESADNISSRASTDYQPELIQPDQVSVSGAVTAEARPVLSPLGESPWNAAVCRFGGWLFAALLRGMGSLFPLQRLLLNLGTF